MMNLTESKGLGAESPRSVWMGRRLTLLVVFLVCSLAGTGAVLSGPTPPIGWAAGFGALAGPAAPSFSVSSYVVHGSSPLSTNVLATLFAPYTGTNVSVAQLVSAGAELHQEYVRQGEPSMSVAIPLREIRDGVVTMYAFATPVPQVLVSGQTYIKFTTPPEITLPEMAASQQVTNPPTEKAPVAPAAHLDLTAPAPPPRPATPAELAQARVLLLQQMAEQAAAEADTRVHVVESNSGPRFEVKHYEVMGNTVLSPAILARTMTNIDGDFGTNVSFEGIRTAVTELQKAYTVRGYVTVSVGLPQQKLTNATVKIQVTEGRLEAIEVKGNHYFSSNNVMRALPSLHTNMILNAKVFQAELNRANANQDRQIYPVIEPGPDPGTSDLTLKIKDRLPLHAKVELNNQSSPGTPDLRLNSSAVYDNLWQQENSLGVQYSFSPGFYKDGAQWNTYDVPLVANYSTFYRMPLGNPQAIEDVIDSNPGSFGYDEATRKFNLPPTSGQPELNFFASRSTIDTGLQPLSSSVLYDLPGVRVITQDNVQQDLTVNNDIGARFNTPLKESSNFRSDFSGGLDFKTYESWSYKTNVFNFAEITLNQYGQPNPPTYSSVVSPVPATHLPVKYLPLSLAYNASWQLDQGTLAAGLGSTINTWYSGPLKTLQAITGSGESSGHWVTLTPSLSWQMPIYTNWPATLRADGQWASEPLISNEQYGAGGINSVRGYREGEVFGDTGWHVTLEQQTPEHVVGVVHGHTLLTLRGTVYMDYATVYLLDPQSRPPSTALWGTGFGGVASVGSHWEARFLFSVPLLGTTTTPVYQPFFNFALTAQF